VRQPAERIERLAALLVAITTLGSLLIGDMRTVLGVGLGGAVAALNFWALRRIMQGILTSGNPRRQIVMTLLLMTKLVILAAAIYVIVRFVPVHPLALIAGISVVVLAILIEGVRIVVRGASAAPTE
jgi:hypothetical protein